MQRTQTATRLLVIALLVGPLLPQCSKSNEKPAGTILTVESLAPEPKVLEERLLELGGEEVAVKKWDFRQSRLDPVWVAGTDVSSLTPTEDGLLVEVGVGFPIVRLNTPLDFGDFNALRVRFRIGDEDSDGLLLSQVSWNWGDEIRGDVQLRVPAGQSDAEDGFQTIDFMLGQHSRWGFHEIFRLGFVPFFLQFPGQPTTALIESITLLKLPVARLLAESRWTPEDPRLTLEQDTRLAIPARLGADWFSPPFVPNEESSVAYEPLLTQMLAVGGSQAVFRTEVWVDGRFDRVLKETHLKRPEGGGPVHELVEASLEPWAGQKIRIRFALKTPKDTEPAIGGIWIEPRLYRRGPLSEKPSRPRRVVLVTLDTTRPDYLSPYGNDWVETPLLQELADTGTLFEVCYATTNSTAPSHASIMSSLYLQDHRLTQNGLRLPSAVETIAERFKKAGYRTAAAVSVFHLSHYTAGIGQGFDHFISPPAGVHHPSAEQTNARIDALLDGPLADQPLFLWIHYFDPHAPYEPPGKFDRLYYPGSDPSAANHTGLGMGAPEDRSSNAYWSWLDGVRDLDFVKRQYGAELTYTDAMLGQILKRIREEEPRTLTVVTADHGESLGEHGILTDHLGLHDPVTRVPLILNGPGVPAAHRVAGAVSTVDIAPTLIELCGLRALPLARGRSLVPFFESAKSPAGDVFFEHAKGWQRGVRRGGKKLLEHLVDISASYRGYVFETGRKELYDLNEDPLELKDLGRSAESFEELETLLKRFRESRVGDFEQGSGQMSPELERMLEALGYLGGEDDKDR